MAEQDKKKRSNFANMTPEELKHITSLGGKKSGEARRRKRDLRQATDLLLSLKVKDPNLKKEMLEGGVKKGDLDNQMALVFKQFVKALSGSTRAAEFLADVLGERSQKENNAINQLDEQDDPLTSSIKEMLGIQEPKEDE